MYQQHQKIIEEYIKAYNNFDVPGMCQYLREDVVFQNISEGQVNLSLEGLEQFRTQAESAKAYFSQRKQTPLSWDFQDEKVIVEIDYDAVLAVDFPNGMKKGTRMQLKGTSEFEFKGDVIVRIVDRS